MLLRMKLLTWWGRAGGLRPLAADAAPICTHGGDRCAEVGCDCLLVVFGALRDLLLSAKHLFFAAKWAR